ncbi:MAG: nicotinate-nucleotide--dimethylbenzimidazole phosphoribosyltransferase [Chitinophagaceae bacterium]|nr:nicotinate-nucleotide--dimethylbenzimidazole phosphoribosyltransferase [Chitinophagaceae bacterium]
MIAFSPTRLQQIIDTKTKPVGALGELERIALQIGTIQQSYTPSIHKPYIVVFAADHGIALSGLVNPYPQAVTAQMVQNFTNGGAAINVFTELNQIDLLVVDAGVNADLSTLQKNPLFIDAKQGLGTNNYLDTIAMSVQQVETCIEMGKDIVAKIYATGSNTIGFGEMGIGNTSSAALILSAITGISITEATGRGTGVTDLQLAVKIKTLEQVHATHNLASYSNNPIGLLSCIGGFEIAMITGAYLAAAEKNMVIVVDGFIATAALLVAYQIHNSILRNCIFAHTSGEKGHTKMLQYLKAEPLLNLGMRLGEGTGAALAIPLIRGAIAFLNHMASFEEAAVSTI